MRKNNSVSGGRRFHVVIVVALLFLMGGSFVRAEVTVITMANTNAWHFMAAGGTVTPWLTLGNGSMYPQGVDDSNGYYLKRAFYKPARFKDFTMEYDFKFGPYFDGSGMAGVIVRAQDWHNGYMVYVPWGGQTQRAKNAWVGVGKIKETGYIHNLTLSQAVNVTSEIDRWYHVKIDLYGSILKVWVDGCLVVSLDNIFPKDGFIGLTGQSDYYFKNITVSGESLPASEWGEDTIIPRMASQTALSGPDGTDGTKYNIFPSACKTSSGDILIGSGKNIYRSSDHGLTWTAARANGLDADDVSIQDYTQMFMRADNKLLIFQTKEVSRTYGNTVMEMRAHTSNDNGLNWTAFGSPQTWSWTYDPNYNLQVYFSGPPVESSDGTIVRLFYTTAREGRLSDLNGREFTSSTWGASVAPKAFAIRSTDGGLTWSMPIEVDAPAAYSYPRNTISGSIDMTETAPVAIGNTIMATIRPVYSPQMWQCWSHDSGANWDAAVRTTFPGYAQSIVRLSSGAIVSSQRFPGYSINVSWDNGLNWDAGTVIDSFSQGMGCLVEAEPDVVICVYLDNGSYGYRGNMWMQRIRITPKGNEPSYEVYGSTTIFSENFQTYVGDTYITGATNINGWASISIPIVTQGTGAPEGVGTFVPDEGMKVSTITLGGADTQGTVPHPAYAGAKLGTEASAASIAMLPTGTATLDMDFKLKWGSSRDAGTAGVHLYDSSNGTYVGWNTYGAAFFLDTSDDKPTGNNFSDTVQGYTTATQHMQVVINFDTGTAQATVSSATLTYSRTGGHSATSDVYLLPTGFEPDTIILWNAGYEINTAYDGGPSFDNIILAQPNAVHVIGSGHVCGDSGTEYTISDINKDCHTNLIDLALFAANWLTDTDPSN